MKAEVFPSILAGNTRVDGSKSIAQRVVACALMAAGETEIHNYPDSLDCSAALTVAQQLGAIVTRSGNTVKIKGGFPANFHSGIRNPKTTVSCGESGLSARMFTSVAALYSEEITISGSGSLLKRPLNEVVNFLPPLGVSVTSSNGLLPVKIKGPMRGGNTSMDGSTSSQYLTGLLLAAAKSPAETTIRVDQLNSIPYVDLTIEIAKYFGVAIKHKNHAVFTIKGGQNYKANEFTVDGDWSGAAFLLVAAALCSEEGVTVQHLNRNFTQADSRIIDVLNLCGAHVIERKNSVTVKKSRLHGFEFDATHCPDLFPALAVLAAFADGVCTIHGAKRLIHKESNRAKILQDEFAKANIRVVVRENEMKVYPGYVSPAVIQSHNDHRIAMAATVLGLAGSKMTISGVECVAKSFPAFFDVMSGLGARIRLK